MTNTKLPRIHMSFYVSDLAATVNFYTTFFGQSASKVKKGYAKYEMENPGLIITFIENPERVQANFGHVGIQVALKEEMEAKLKIAREQGVVSLEEIGVSCCYAVQDKFWATDPDGIQWEVYYFHEDSEFNDPKYIGKEVNACCSPTEEKVKVSIAEVVNGESCEPGSGCC